MVLATLLLAVGADRNMPRADALVLTVRRRRRVRGLNHARHACKQTA